MHREDIERSLRGCRFGRRVLHFESIDSTNDRALRDLDEGIARDGDVYLADRQTRGRGTGDRHWHSPPNEGLWTSMVVEGGSAARPLPFLPAIALADELSSRFGLAVHLKWPNDVLIDQRKLAGILVEGRSSRARGTSYVVGFGLNLAQESFPPELGDLATSLVLEGVHAPDRDELLVALLRRMSLMDAMGLDLVAAFRARCRMIGRVVRNRSGESLLVLDLNEEGHLLVRDESGRDRLLVRAPIRN